MSKTMVNTSPKPSSILTFIDKGLEFVISVVENIGAIMLSVMVLTITWQVISRITRITSSWTEEIAIMLLVWFGMTGAAIGVRKGTHIGVEFLYNLFPAVGQKVLDIITNVLIFTFAAFIFFEGIELAKGCWTIQMTATLLPRGQFVYLAIPTASVLMMLYSAENIWKLLVNYNGGAQQ